MTLAIAWGTPDDAGGPPGKDPFVPGTQGARPYAALVHDRFVFGLTENPGYAVATVVHTFAPASGGPEYVVGTYYLYRGAISKSFLLGSFERNGLHTMTAYVAYQPLPVKLVLAITPNNNPGNNWYGSEAWYEDTGIPPAFWTRFINSKEVTE